MFKNKKLLILALVLMLSIALVVGCGGNDAPAPSESEDGDGEVVQEEQYVLQFAHVVRPTIAKGRAADYFAELVEERSNGRIKVEVFPDSQLGTDAEITDQMQIGTIQMNAPFTGVLPSYVPQFQLFDLPFLFPDKKVAYDAMHGPVGDILNQHLLDVGLRSLGYWDGGFKHFTNSIRPIETPKDIEGLAFRVSQSPLLISQFKALGAGGISIAFAELYTALQNGTVDGQENTLDNIYSRGFYEVQDYLTISKHGYLGYVVLISEDFYQSLPADLQQIIEEVVAEVTEWQWELAASEENEYLENLRNSGIHITELTPEQEQAFIEATAIVYDEFEENVPGGKELLEAIREVRGY